MKKILFLALFIFTPVLAYNPHIEDIVTTYGYLTGGTTQVISSGSVYLNSIEVSNLGNTSSAISLSQDSNELYRFTVLNDTTLSIPYVYFLGTGNIEINNLSGTDVNYRATGYLLNQAYTDSLNVYTGSLSVSTGSTISGPLAVYMTESPSGNSGSYLSGSTNTTEYLPAMVSDIRMYLIAYIFVTFTVIIYLLMRSFLNRRNKLN